MKTLIKTFCVVLTTICMVFVSCEPMAINPTPTSTGDSIASLRGMYVLNEGGFSLNNASLDYLDFATGIYTLDTFSHANPTLPNGLGDVANDMVIVGNKLYIAINGSGIVEVIDAHTAQHIASLQVPNCRRLSVHEGWVYVTSYAGRKEDDSHQLGYVARIDTANWQIVSQQEVGYQPEGMAIMNNRLYVANSGGYIGMNTGIYDDRITVLNASASQQLEHITVAPNLQQVIADPKQQVLWISSFGNYYDVAANLYRLDPTSTQTIEKMDIPVSQMTLVGDTLYVMASSYDADWKLTTTFYKLDTQTRTKIEIQTDTDIAAPYAMAVNPVTKDLYISDAGDYVNPGTLYCFTPNGRKKWQLRTGVLPKCFAFVP